MISIEELKVHATNMRKHIMDMGYHAGNHAAHIGGALSMVDILSVLYFGISNICEVGIHSPERDRVILSKGHGSLGYYSALIEAGFIDEKIKTTFEDDYSVLLGHPVRNRDLGIEFTNGSLGMGLSVGIGVAIANKRVDRNNKVYVIVGDGECNEGSCWEAFMAAPHFGLDNLTVIIDKNEYQLSGSTEEVMQIKDINGSLKAFGWDVIDIDGHNYDELISAFSINNNKMPKAIIAHTIKGKGFSFSENTNTWHHAIVTEKVYKQAMDELGVRIE